MAFRFAGFADEAGKTLEEQIAVTKALGWSAIEVRLMNGKHFCDFTDQEFDDAWGKMQDAGVGIACFGSQVANWSRPISGSFQVDVDELRRSIPRMHKAGTKLIRCMSYPNSKEPLPRAQWKKEVFRRMRELARIAKDGGVLLAHENCSGYGGEGVQECLEMLEAVNNDAFAIIFDTGNQPHAGGNLWEYYQKVKSRVIHVHVKATKMVDGKRQVCHADEDGDDVPRKTFQDLKNRGYDGWISIEPHLAAQVHAGQDVKDARTAADLYVEYGRRMMKIIEGLR
jgi:sugar phosphate isomerase/epimerase